MLKNAVYIVGCVWFVFNGKTKGPVIDSSTSADTHSCLYLQPRTVLFGLRACFDNS